MKNDRQKAEFLRYYSKIVDMVVSSRNSGKTLAQIALELNLAGYVTREGSQFSQIHISRILGKVAQPGAHDSSQNAALESQVQSEVELLKIEIYTLKTQVAQLQQELSDLKSQVVELKQEIELKKVNYSEIPDTSQVVEMGSEPARPMTAKPPRQVDSEIKKVVLQQAIELHSKNIELSKSEIARDLSHRFDVRFETARDWLKRAW